MPPLLLPTAEMIVRKGAGQKFGLWSLYLQFAAVEFGPIKILARLPSSILLFDPAGGTLRMADNKIGI